MGKTRRWNFFYTLIVAAVLLSFMQATCNGIREAKWSHPDYRGAMLSGLVMNKVVRYYVDAFNDFKDGFFGERSVQTTPADTSSVKENKHDSVK